LYFQSAQYAYGQENSPQDLSAWGWFQLYKNIDSANYVSVQFELRKNNNCSTFQSNNFYFLGGVNLNKNLNFEAIYQLNTNYSRDISTLYAGLTYRVKMNKKFSWYFRTALQHNQNHLLNPDFYNQAYNEWRNRARLKFKASKNIDLSLSAEPTIHFNVLQHRTYLDKIRFVAQVSDELNKYSSITLFYIVQPDIVSFGNSPGINYMIGATYKITLPNKWKKMDNIFKFKNKDKAKGSEPMNDSFLN
jgi:hypothetical protein